ncbi:MAG: carbamoyltransferase HypF [Candidatus Hydrogenedentota bacterium]|nr:MAG: carbamoyltransferase HypF [Candidatus Hydrogenedentota bacterium]GIX43676.1 MAG: carbamoyltransferase HypF [Candidatus Sumerlaea sp.]
MKTDSAFQRLHLSIRGTVQGVGFRPFVYRLATELGLTGWVVNDSQGVEVEVEGRPAALAEFRSRLHSELPPRATILSEEARLLDPVGYPSFEIRESQQQGPPTALVLPDIATCPDCLREVFNPSDRRYLYPFTNCTNCGPRYSIIRRLPYDRPNTTMAGFAMCPECRREYEDPTDRRFHAQPIACPQCGPQLELLDASGKVLAQRHDALLAAAHAIREGRIVALKGLGGFQLLVDARNDDAVRRLRARKRREEKPFALMVPTLSEAAAIAVVGEVEAQILTSPASPILLLPRRDEVAQSEAASSSQRSTSEDAGSLGVDATRWRIAPSVAPNNPELGIMLPYTPLHHLLMCELAFPVVATSGNLTDEPICIATEEALERLGDVADFFLTHDRPIERYVDDSVVRVMAGREVVLRRARGYAPLPIPSPFPIGRTVFATGAHLKNTVALVHGGHIFVSQHIGDLETEPAQRAHREAIRALTQLYDSKPEVIACDLHPDYASTRSAREIAQGRTLLLVQHHRAHVWACLAENELLHEPVLGVAWDGTGLGDDGQIWGSEFFLVDPPEPRRIAHFRPIPIPGGDAAMREPRRVAFGVLWEMAAEEWSALFPHCAPLVSPEEARVWGRMIAQRLNSPLTCGAGRLFDAVAALLGLRAVAAYEGQAAMIVEWAARRSPTREAYPLAWRIENAGGAVEKIEGALPASVSSERPIQFDWETMIRAILADVGAGEEPAVCAAKFHNTLVRIIVEIAGWARRDRVALSGGCFQNRLLVESAMEALQANGFRVYIHQRIPPNDGGIALGQAVAACLQASER